MEIMEYMEKIMEIHSCSYFGARFVCFGCIVLFYRVWYLFVSICYVYIWRFVFYSTCVCTPDSVLKSNNDEEAINNFLQQIEKTEESIQIFDDGDYMKNSIYNKDEVIKTLECKIEENSRFRLDIHFNENEGTEEKRLKIYQLKDDCPKNISIKDGLSKKRNDDFHFKISDFGKYCYVSKHKRGEESRMYLEYHKKPYRITHPMVVKCQKLLQSNLLSLARAKFNYF